MASDGPYANKYKNCTLSIMLMVMNQIKNYKTHKRGHYTQHHITLFSYKFYHWYWWQCKSGVVDKFCYLADRLSVDEDLHMAQLMPLPLSISCSGKSRLVLPSWFYPSVLLVPAHPGSPRQNWRGLVVCVCVTTWVITQNKKPSWTLGVADRTAPSHKYNHAVRIW